MLRISFIHTDSLCHDDDSDGSAVATWRVVFGPVVPVNGRASKTSHGIESLNSTSFKKTSSSLACDQSSCLEITQ